MTEHKHTADYHRGEVAKEVSKQGSGNYGSGDGWASSRGRQLEHTNAAHAADRAHAAATGQTVRYTPVGEPVFSKH